ncbi:ROK family transcriptional regulator [Mesorhizobium sp. L-8-10]|uniref:ROK family transcriptional regulator n=1 Tax=Mesorhizobium sp. L-8-10 TaxID=2744523 RepID=UPI001927193E|nr:ROK family transcriptional regulator [Mesorhizobium sp. L-8-10]
MRFAPPNPLRIADRASGLNALSVRSYNERLVLSLLLQNEGTSRMEIGEKTGLSAQTVSVIVRSLEQEGLVAKGEAQRGRVGPPTIPLSLNPEGAYAVGISFSYRKVDVVLIDFVGKVRFHRHLPLEMIGNDDQAHLLDLVGRAVADLPASLHGRIAGIGLAIPEGIESWADLRNGTSLDPAALQARIENQAGLPVFVQNDITAAAGGESMFGVAKPLSDYLFFYLGARLHSRLILNHQIYHGNSKVSFDVGILSLEEMLAARRQPTDALWERNSQWPDYGEAFESWRRNCREKLAQSIEALSQFVDVGTVVLSSYAPVAVCQGICDDLGRALPDIHALAGGIEISPKAVGAASLPFSSRFMVK